MNKADKIKYQKFSKFFWKIAPTLAKGTITISTDNLWLLLQLNNEFGGYFYPNFKNDSYLHLKVKYTKKKNTIKINNITF